MYDLTKLTNQLKKAGFRTHVETSGAYPLTGIWDWICVSPKKFKSPLPEVLKCADELKVIVFHKSDLGWSDQFIDQVKQGCALYLQPEWDKRNEAMPLIIDFVKKNPAWRTSLQSHKYLNIP